MAKKDNSREEQNNDLNEQDSSFGSSNKRSSKFNDILGSSNNQGNSEGGVTTAKEKFKKVWKWIVIGIYLFLAGLGVTGLIQSCVLKTSSTVGAGVELYNDGNIAPYVTTFKIVEKEREVIKYDENGSPELDANGNIVKVKEKYYELEKLVKENYLTSNATIEKIKNDLRSEYGVHGEKIQGFYGDYGNYSTSIRIIGLNNREINNANISSLDGDVSNNGLLVGDKTSKIIFINNKILDFLNENSIAYKSQNNWHDINYFVRKRPDDWDSLSNASKNYYGSGITDLSGAFVAYEEINGQHVKVEQLITGDYITNDINGDGIVDSYNPVVITDQNRINKFKYKLEAEVATLSASEVGLLNSEAYARDYAQSLANVIVKFNQLNDFYNLIENWNKPTQTNVDVSKLKSSDIFQTYLTKDKLQSLVSPTQTEKGLSNKRINQSNGFFTLQQKNAILAYQQEMTSLMEKIGFGIRKQVYDDQTSDYYVSDKTTPFKIEFLPFLKDKKNHLIGIGTAEQKPITSWAESWKLGPFYGLIVYPLSAIINGMMGPMPNVGGWEGVIAIVVAILITRIIVTLFTYKSLFSTHKQQQLSPKKAKIDAKYAPFKGNREMEQRKRQELAKLYKSNNISMIEPFKAMCISMPIFFAVWRVVQGIPDIKATTWLGIQFSLTSWKELFNGAWQYLPLLLIAATVQAISQLLPRILNNKRLKERANRAEQAALKKSNKTQNIVMIVFIVMSVIFEAGVQIYWIVSGLWQIMQILVVHHIVKSEWYRTKGYKYT